MRYRHWVPVAAPPIDPAEEFLSPKSEPGELVGTLCRRIATYPVAIDDIDLAVVEPSSGLGTDLAMWEVDGAGDVGSGVRIVGAGVDYDDVGKSGSEINGQIPRISLEAQLVFIALAISPGSGAPYSRTAEISRVMIDSVFEGRP